MKIFCLFHRALSMAQVLVIRDLHGEDAEVIYYDPVVLNNPDEFADYIRKHSDGFVYIEAEMPYFYTAPGFIHFFSCSLAGLSFGMFEVNPQRQDGGFDLAAVYHVDNLEPRMVWSTTQWRNKGGMVSIPVIH